MPFVSPSSDLSYSQLLEQIRSGEISALELVPARREVVATYPDGTRKTVSIFLNDQQILRAAESSATPLTVKDIRQEQAMAGLLGNIGLILIVVIGLSFLLRNFFQYLFGELPRPLYECRTILDFRKWWSATCPAMSMASANKKHVQ